MLLRLLQPNAACGGGVSSLPDLQLEEQPDIIVIPLPLSTAHSSIIPATTTNENWVNERDLLSAAAAGSSSSSAPFHAGDSHFHGL